MNLPSLKLLLDCAFSRLEHALHGEFLWSSDAWVYGDSSEDHASRTVAKRFDEANTASTDSSPDKSLCSGNWMHSR